MDREGGDSGNRALRGAGADRQVQSPGERSDAAVLPAAQSRITFPVFGDLWLTENDRWGPAEASQHAGVCIRKEYRTVPQCGEARGDKGSGGSWRCFKPDR